MRGPEGYQLLLPSKPSTQLERPSGPHAQDQSQLSGSLVAFYLSEDLEGHLGTELAKPWPYLLTIAISVCLYAASLVSMATKEPSLPRQESKGSGTENWEGSQKAWGQCSKRHGQEPGQVRRGSWE